MPLKKEKIRANHPSYITKAFHRAIMKITQLQIKYFKTKTQIDYASIKKQRNLCSKLYKKERRKHYEIKNMENDIKNVNESINVGKALYHFSQVKLIGLRKVL